MKTILKYLLNGALLLVLLGGAGCAGSTSSVEETSAAVTVTFSPVDAATDVAVDATITTTFSGAITEPDSWVSAFTLKKADAGDSLCTAVTYDSTAHIATCAHENLENSANYTLAISGITEVTDTQISFQTVAVVEAVPVAPEVVTLASGLADVLLDYGDHTFKCDTDNCYFVRRETGKICRVPTAGGDVNCPFEGLSRPQVINISGSTLCWADDVAGDDGGKNIFCGPTEGGDIVATPIDQAPGGFEISSDGNTFYWGSETVVRKKAHGDTDMTTLDSSQTKADTLLLVGETLYFTNEEGGSGVRLGIKKISTSGGAVTSVVADSVSLVSSVLASDGTWLCYLEGTLGLSDGAAKCLPINGGETVTLATDLKNPTNLHIDGGNLIIGEVGDADLNAQSFSGNGRILSIPLAGGTPTILVENIVNFDGLQVVGDTIYFTDGTGANTVSIKKVHE